MQAASASGAILAKYRLLAHSVRTVQCLPFVTGAAALLRYPRFALLPAVPGCWLCGQRVVWVRRGGGGSSAA